MLVVMAVTAVVNRTFIAIIDAAVTLITMISSISSAFILPVPHMTAIWPESILLQTPDMTSSTAPLLEVERRGNIEDSIKDNRNALKKKGTMALGHLVYAALGHASAAISHPDQTLDKGIEIYRSRTKEQWLCVARSVVTGVWHWAEHNPIKVILMVVGLGISVLKAKAMSQCMLGAAGSFCVWNSSSYIHLISITRFFLAAKSHSR